MNAISERKSTIPLIGRIIIGLILHPSGMRKKRGKNVEDSFFLSENILAFRVRINNVTVIHTVSSFGLVGCDEICSGKTFVSSQLSFLRNF